MIVCTQCNGKKVTQGTESIIDPNSNAEKFHSPMEKPAAVPCSQCNGTGIMTGGSF
jgi:hypothetical protein